jgi:hypothetical protein
MAAAGTVEIRVELDGAGQAEKALNTISRGAERAAGGFTQMGAALSASSNKVTASVGGIASSVGALTSGISQMGAATTGASAGLVSMLGPIAAIGTAFVGVVYAVKRYIDSTNDLDERLEAIRKGAAEFTSVLEQLADANIELTAAEHQNLMQLATNAQMQTEYVQLLREGNGVIGKRIELAQKEQARAAAALQTAQQEAEAQRTAIRIRLQNNRQLTASRRAQLEDLEVRRLSHDAQVAYNRATQRAARIEAELIPLIQEAAKARRELTNEQERLTEAQGRSAIEAAERERAKLLQENANTLRSIGALQIQTEAEAAQARMSTLAFQTRQLQSQQHQRISQVRALEQAQLERINKVFESEKAALTRQLELQTITARQFNDRTTALEAQRARQQQQFASDRELAETLIIESAIQRRAALRRAAAERRRAMAAQAQAQREAQERAELQDLARLEEARIRLYMEGEQQRIALIELRHNTAQQLAQTEAQRETASLVRQRELLDIERQRAAQREQMLEKLRDLSAQNIELMHDLNAAFAKLDAFDFGPLIQSAEQFSQSVLTSAVSAKFMGESMKAAVGEALTAVAIQATVESLMATGRGLIALAMGLPAAAYFQSALAFGTAAAVAGSVGHALTPGESSGGGAGRRSGTSPSGAPQAAPRGARGDDEDRAPITINVNMGNAVIYDTQAAAERAFADRVVRTINSPRRGAVRLRRS